MTSFLSFNSWVKLSNYHAFDKLVFTSYARYFNCLFLSKSICCAYITTPRCYFRFHDSQIKGNLYVRESLLLKISQYLVENSPSLSSSIRISQFCSPDILTHPNDLSVSMIFLLFKPVDNLVRAEQALYSHEYDLGLEPCFLQMVVDLLEVIQTSGCIHVPEHINFGIKMDDSNILIDMLQLFVLLYHHKFLTEYPNVQKLDVVIQEIIRATNANKQLVDGIQCVGHHSLEPTSV